MRKILIGLLALFVSLCCGCSKSIEEMLIGSWDFSIYFSASDVEKMSGESFPDGFSIEITAVGNQTYHVGGKYDGTGEFTVRMTVDGQEYPLKFFIKDAGSWEIHDDVLVETTGDSIVTPMNEGTEQVVKEIPILQAMLTPVSGESQSTKILHISETLVEFQMLESPYMNFTLEKQS